MKNVIITIAAGLLIAVGFTSCEKKYDCSCTFDNETVHTSEVKKSDKDGALDKCKENAGYNANNDIVCTVSGK